MADTIKTFEDGIKRLEEIVAKLEKGDIALDEAAELYGEGVALTAKCTGQLEAARLRITGLDAEDNNG